MSSAVKPTKAFWIISVVFLLWNAFGCFLYYQDVTMTDAAYAATYGDAMAAVRPLYPAWGIAAYAVAVWGGLLAAILLLLRKKIAAPLFILSLICAVISFAGGMLNEEIRAASGSTGWIMPVIVTAIGVIEVLFSRSMRGKGVLT